jgi:hypothetical protein
MATTIQIKSSETVNSVPTAGQLSAAELAVNLADGKLFSKKSDGTIVTLAGNTTATTYYIPTILGLITETADFGTDFGSITSAVSSGNMQDTNTNSDVTFDSVETSSITIGGKQAVNGPAFSAYAAATVQTITSGSQQKVLFQTEEFDTNNNFASSRFTPTVAGYYQLNAEVRFDGVSGTGEMMIVLYKNGAEYKRGTNQSGTQIAANFWAMTVSSLVYANGSTDYFEIYVQQGSGGNLNVTAVNNPAITWFNGCMLRGA